MIRLTSDLAEKLEKLCTYIDENLGEFATIPLDSHPEMKVFYSDVMEAKDWIRDLAAEHRSSGQ